jgi:hypothetical protein
MMPLINDVTHILEALEKGDAKAAEVLGIAVPNTKLWWAYARAWLRVEMTKDSHGRISG